MPQADCFYKIRTVYSFFFTESVGEKALCTFEKGNMCGYIQDKDDDFDWKSSRYLYRTSLSDHTYGTRSGIMILILELLFLVC